MTIQAIKSNRQMWNLLFRTGNPQDIIELHTPTGFIVHKKGVPMGTPLLIIITRPYIPNRIPAWNPGYMDTSGLK